MCAVVCPFRNTFPCEHDWLERDTNNGDYVLDKTNAIGMGVK